MIRELKAGSKNLLQVGRLLEEYVLRRGVCSMSASIYDTAWVSMVSKPVEGKATWLFPASFGYICDTQQESGGWEGGDVIDEIVNALACLLSFKRHEKVDSEPSELADRIDRATRFLTAKLAVFDSHNTERVAFEILIPSLIDLLEVEGASLQFPDAENLRKLHQTKMSKINFQLLYKYPSTMLHSLESFIGTIDFDKMGHHLVEGSMMGSPSSTAAYLMNVTEWDDNAEKYLRDAIENGKRNGEGSVTNVFPISTFEFAWSTCNILENGMDVDPVYRERIAGILGGYLEEGRGLTGFDPSVHPDADDTAKAITALQLLGQKPSFDSLIERFEMETHFQCFPFERNPSFSANCNVLLAFLYSPDPSQYLSQISKCVRYICYEWWNTDEPVKDKWNLSPYYPALLASQALIRLLHLYESQLLEIDASILRVKVMVVLFQILTRTLQQQAEDGSWGVAGSREETAYAVITLANVDSLPFVTPIASQIESAISRGRKYLKSIKALEDIKLTATDHIWAGKVSYGVENVCHSYVLGALNAQVPQYLLGPRVSGLVNIPSKRVSSFSKFYAKLPMFKDVDAWKIKAWLIEGYLFLPDLEKMRLGVFNRGGMDEDKYFEYLPFSWTGPNGLESTNAGAQTLFDMMIISMVNYQVDEFFDGVVARGDLSTIALLKRNIEKLFSDSTAPSSVKDTVNGTVNGFEDLPTYDQDIYNQLSEFLNFVVSYPRIQSASLNDKSQLQLELKSYLLAHTQQCEDSIKLRRQGSQKIYTTPPSSYMRWVRNTASDHLSSTYAFAFMVCLLGVQAEYFPNSEVQYMARDCCTHLSVICRMFNDYGSLERDRKESNLNSMFFPEFNGKGKSDAELRTELVRLTKYERKCLALSFEELASACGDRHRRIYDMMRLFYNASEIYTEVYEVKDLSTWH